MWTPAILAATILIIAGSSLAYAENNKPVPKKVWPSSELAARQPTRLQIEQLSSGIYGAATPHLVEPIEWQHRRAVDFNDRSPKRQNGENAPLLKSVDE